MTDILGTAIYDFYFNDAKAKLWVHDLHGPKVEMQIPVYFRHPSSMPELEQMALKECRGKVLDIGAGAGSHALTLQEQGFDVTALDISPKATEVMHHRGVKNVVCGDVYGYTEAKYDTLLLLMNGIGLTATLDGLRKFLAHAKDLIDAAGQLIFDSSNVAYLFEESVPEDAGYYGEIRCRYEYKQKKTDWFTWLYVDQETLQRIATAEGWLFEKLFEDEEDQYLARLTRM